MLMAIVESISVIISFVLYVINCDFLWLKNRMDLHAYVFTDLNCFDKTVSVDIGDDNVEIDKK